MALTYASEQKYLPLIKQASAKYNVPEVLILAHMKQESGFNPYAYRAEPAIKDASYGLMQVLLNTAKTIDRSATTDKLYDPAYNIGIGTAYISKNLSRYPNDLSSAIASYNAGSAYKDSSGRFVSKSGNPSVQDYVDRVLRNHKNYTEWLGSGANLFDIKTLILVSSIVVSGIVLYIYMERQ